jgi:hypothetical protein
MKSLREEWELTRSEAIDPDLSEDMIEAFRLVFYKGAMTVFSCLVESGKYSAEELDIPGVTHDLAQHYRAIMEQTLAEGDTDETAGS